MSDLVKAWSESQERIARVEAEGQPDSLTLGGVKIEFPREENMGKAKTGDRQLKVLLPHQFDNIIRQIKRGAFDSVGLIKGATDRTLERLNVKPQPQRAVTGIPNGSNDANSSALLGWMEKLTLEDKRTKPGKRAVRQLLAINATATARLEG